MLPAATRSTKARSSGPCRCRVDRPGARQRGGGVTRAMAFDKTHATFAANRAVGRVALTVATLDGRSRRARVREQGSLRVRFPHGDGEALDAVLVNTAGGIAGGDRFDIAVTVGEGARLTVTTAAAEKVYRAPET